MRVLAIDYGRKRFGMAVSDDTGLLASPLETVESRGLRRDAAEVVAVLQRQGAARLVIGLPRGLEEGPGAAEPAARRFGAAVQQALGEAGLSEEIVWWDERFSTREALSQMRAAGISQREGRSAVGANSTDARAAAVILQGYLDAQRQDVVSHRDDEDEAAS